MEELLLNYLRNEILSKQAASELAAEDDLLGSGLLDSIGLMRMIVFIESTFDTKVPPEDLVIENFSSITCIVNYLQSCSLPSQTSKV